MVKKAKLTYLVAGWGFSATKTYDKKEQCFKMPHKVLQLSSKPDTTASLSKDYM